MMCRNNFCNNDSCNKKRLWEVIRPQIYPSHSTISIIRWLTVKPFARRFSSQSHGYISQTRKQVFPRPVFYMSRVRGNPWVPPSLAIARSEFWAQGREGWEARVSSLSVTRDLGLPKVSAHRLSLLNDSCKLIWGDRVSAVYIGWWERYSVSYKERLGNDSAVLYYSVYNLS